MEEDKKGNEGGGKKNGDSGRAKRGKKKRGGINGSVMKEKECDDYGDAKSWDEHDFDVGGKEGAEWGNNESDKDDGDDNDNDEESEEGEE